MDATHEVIQGEESLRRAMLASDVQTLSTLIDDRLVFTGPDGSMSNKEQDLHAHRSGMLKIERLEFTDSSVHQIDDMVLVTSKVRLVGSFGGSPIHGRFSHTRL